MWASGSGLECRGRVAGGERLGVRTFLGRDDSSVNSLPVSPPPFAPRKPETCARRIRGRFFLNTMPYILFREYRKGRYFSSRESWNDPEGGISSLAIRPPAARNLRLRNREDTLGVGDIYGISSIAKPSIGNGDEAMKGSGNLRLQENPRK